MSRYIEFKSDNSNNIINCITANRSGSIFAVGFQNGLVRTYITETCTEFNCFEPFARDKKYSEVISLDTLEDYLLAMDHNGTISIITRM